MKMKKEEEDDNVYFTMLIDNFSKKKYIINRVKSI